MAARQAEPRSRHRELPKERERPDDRARLALTETVLFNEEPTGAARSVLRWLIAHARVTAGLVLVREPDAPRLLTLAVEGVSAVDFTVDLTAVDEPFSVLLEGRRPVQLKKN